MTYIIQTDQLNKHYKGTMVRITFTIFTSVLIVKLIIDKYKNKSIAVMFTYPINRKKIYL